MISKFKDEEAMGQTIIEITPDDLMTIARKLQLEAGKAFPGEEITYRMHERFVLKYDPLITTATAAGRNKLPGTTLSEMIDKQIETQVGRDEAVGTMCQ